MRAWDTTQALHFMVCDTGCGFDRNATPRGAGLSNMHDRIAAVGGTLVVTRHDAPDIAVAPAAG